MLLNAHELEPGAALRINRVRSGVESSDGAPMRQTHYQLIWVEGGHGAHEIDFVPYSVAANRLFLIAPGQVHRWLDNAFQGRIFTFRKNVLDAPSREQLLFASGLHGWAGAQPTVELASRAASELITLGNLLEGECHSDPVDRIVVASLLNAFAVVLARTARELHAPGRDERVAELLSLIDGHYIVEHSAQFYATRLGLSASRLNQISRQYLRRTVTQLAHDRLVLEARRDLGVTDKDVQAIGHRLGFDDPSYFTRFFRRETGQTPNQFRDAVQVTVQPQLPFERAI